MKPWLIIPILCLALLAALQASAGDVYDVATARGVGNGQLKPEQVFTWKRNIKLAKVTVRELVPSAPSNPTRSEMAFSMGAWQEGTPTFDIPQITTTLVRTIPSLWRLRVSAAEDADALYVSYELESANGHQDFLSNEQRSDAEIRVITQPLTPIVIQHGQGSTIVEGGVVLYLDIADARSAGRYSGTMTVTVHYL